MIARNIGDIVRALQCQKGNEKWKRCGNCDTCPYLMKRLMGDCMPYVMDDAIEFIGKLTEDEVEE